MANTHYTSTTFRDRGGETSAFKLYNGAITSTSIAGFLTNYGDLKGALDALTTGVLAKDLWVGDSTNLDNSRPTDPYAQREIKLLIQYQAVGGGTIYTVTVPTVDLSLLTFLSKDEVAIDQGAEMTALVAAMEAIGRTPNSDTENIEVIGARFVGRNI